MLAWVLRQTLWSAVITLNSENENILIDEAQQPETNTESSSTPDPDISGTLLDCLDYTTDWSQLDWHGIPATPRRWGATFLSKKVLITRDELLTLLRTKLALTPTLLNNVRLVTELHWECFGSITLKLRNGDRRKIVGTRSGSTSNTRRDFVRLRGVVDGTALSAQVCACVLNSHICVLNSHICVF